jgi:hypothetical protein
MARILVNSLNRKLVKMFSYMRSFVVITFRLTKKKCLRDVSESDITLFVSFSPCVGDKLGYVYVMSTPKKPKRKSVEMKCAGRRTGMASPLFVQFVHAYEERMNTTYYNHNGGLCCYVVSDLIFRCVRRSHVFIWYFGHPCNVILCHVVNTGWEMDIRNEQGSSEWGHEGQWQMPR